MNFSCITFVLLRRTFLEKIILKLQLQVAFFTFLSVFSRSSSANHTSNYRHSFSRNSAEQFCREFIDEENKENRKEIGVKIH